MTKWKSHHCLAIVLHKYQEFKRGKILTILEKYADWLRYYDMESGICDIIPKQFVTIVTPPVKKDFPILSLEDILYELPVSSIHKKIFKVLRKSSLELEANPTELDFVSKLLIEVIHKSEQLASWLSEKRKSEIEREIEKCLIQISDKLNLDMRLSLNQAPEQSIQKKLHIGLDIQNCELITKEKVHFVASIYDKYESKFLSEQVLLNLNESLDLRVLFRDYGKFEVHEMLFLVIQVFRVGRIKPDYTRTPLVFYKRPYGCSVINLRKLSFAPIQISAKIYSIENENDFSILHDYVIEQREGLENGFRSEYITVDLCFLDSPLGWSLQVPRSEITELNLSERTLQSNKAYIKLLVQQGEFQHGIKKSPKNIQLIIYLRCGSETISEYESVVLYHQNRPNWIERVSLSIPNIEVGQIHFLFVAYHCSVSEKNTKEPFAFSFLPLVQTGGVVSSQVQKLAVFKFDSKFIDTAGYLQEDFWFVEKDNLGKKSLKSIVVPISNNKTKLVVNSNDSLQIKVDLNSFQFPQHEGIRNVLNGLQGTVDDMHTALYHAQLLDKILEFLLTSNLQKTLELSKTLVKIFCTMKHPKFENIYDHFNACLKTKVLSEPAREKLFTAFQHFNVDEVTKLTKCWNEMCILLSNCLGRLNLDPFIQKLCEIIEANPENTELMNSIIDNIPFTFRHLSKYLDSLEILNYMKNLMKELPLVFTAIDELYAARINFISNACNYSDFQVGCIFEYSVQQASDDWNKVFIDFRQSDPISRPESLKILNQVVFGYTEMWLELFKGKQSNNKFEAKDVIDTMEKFLPLLFDAHLFFSNCSQHLSDSFEDNLLQLILCLLQFSTLLRFDRTMSNKLHDFIETYSKNEMCPMVLHTLANICSNLEIDNRCFKSLHSIFVAANSLWKKTVHYIDSNSFEILSSIGLCEVTLLRHLDTSLSKENFELILDLSTFESKLSLQALKAATDCISKYDIDESQLLNQFDALFSAGRIRPEYVDKLKELNLPKLCSGVKLLEHLRNLEQLPDSVFLEEERTLMTFNLMQFIRPIKCISIYEKYVQQLVNIHLKRNHFVEAAFALECLLDGTESEDLLREIVDYFERGNDFENAIRILEQERRTQEQKYDYLRVSACLLHQSKLYAKILTKERYFPEFFRVGFYGNGFSPGLRNKQFLYAGFNWEKISNFCERMTLKHPGAKLLGNRIVDEKITRSDEQFLQIVKVDPVFSSDKFFQSADEKIQQYLKHSQVKLFSFEKVEKRKADHEFLGLWIEETILETENCFPSMLRISPIVKVSTKLYNPLQNAARMIKAKTSELIYLERKFSRPHDKCSMLTMSISGVVDAPVNGGILLYAKLFLTAEYIKEYPDHRECVSELASLILEQLKVLARCLELHDRIVSAEMRPFHENLVFLFKKNYDEKFYSAIESKTFD